MLAALESGKADGVAEGSDVGADFFATVRAHTVYGFLCDPSYGGNRDYAGWKVVGYPGRQHHRGGYTKDQMARERADRPRLEVVARPLARSAWVW